MPELKFGKKILNTDKPAFVMGIVNATPDSFFAGSRGGIERAFELIDQGADILDIGGESTRPGYTEVPADEEIKRIIPVIEQIRKKSDIAISVDTRKAVVFKAAYESGADVLNDVSAMEDDADMAKIVFETNAGVILMHRFNGNEEERISNPEIIKEVENYFYSRINFARACGINENDIILDPGIGFGKTYAENCLLIKNGGRFFNGKYPVLMALSRKRCIGTMTNTTADQRLAGTVAADIVAVQNGAKLIRVHDVKEAVESLNVLKVLDSIA